VEEVNIFLADEEISSSISILTVFPITNLLIKARRLQNVSVIYEHHKQHFTLRKKNQIFLKKSLYYVVKIKTNNKFAKGLEW
jgi:hypothetical protein